MFSNIFAVFLQYMILQLVFKCILISMNGMNSLNLKTNSLASGIYTVEVRLNNSTEVLKLTIN